MSKKAREKIIMHIDLDAFFAACEENRHPELRGKPLVIGADPKKGKGRGVVSTANYAARKYGIHSGMPISWAYRKCKWANFRKPDIKYCTKISRRALARIKFKTRKSMQTSIDEVTLDVSHLTFKGAENLARQIKKELKQKEKLTCSIGIAPNIPIAKIASDFQKPDGLTPVKPYEVKMFLYPLSVRKLLGVGPKTQEALRKLGIKTIGQLARVSKEKLMQKFGKWGTSLYYQAKGLDKGEVEEGEEAKSIGRQVTFQKDIPITQKKKLQVAMARLVSQTLKDTKKARKKFKTVTIKVRYEDFKTHTKQKKFSSTLASKDAKAWAKELLKPFLKGKKKVRLLGFSVSGLTLSKA